MRLTLLGAPGAGKGTQAEQLCRRLDIPAISTGNILRSAIHDGTSVGLLAQSYIDKGELVPDNIVLDIVKERVSREDCANGFVLDGMPRTVAQAKALEELGIELDAAVSLEVGDEAIIERMGGRRVCPKCGATFHLVSNPPKTDGICDMCGEELIIRPDDAPKTVLSRLETYHTQTEPIKKFYEERGKLHMVDSTGEIGRVTENVLRSLGIGE